MHAITSLIHRLRHSASTLLALSAMHAAAWGAQVGFDLPSAVECRDVTTKEFADAHPRLKVVEAKFRLSARMIEGAHTDIVEFYYVFKTDPTMRVSDYLPNTTLESSVVEDQIEVTDALEKSKALGLDAHVAYKPLVLGGNYNQGSKKSESNHFKQITAKDLVLASGTIDREHGVFFRLRPSRTNSFEGSREFTVTAVVPRTWRGGLCTISCTSKATKRSVISTSVVPSGSASSQVGMYLLGDRQAAALAEQLWLAQESFENLLASPTKKPGILQTISTEAAEVFTGKTADQRPELTKAEHAVLEVQKRIEQLAR